MSAVSTNRNLNESSAEALQAAKKNRPKASRLRQQKLPAWQPILTATTVIPTIFLIGIIFIPIGIALLWASSSVNEWSEYYEDCAIDTICKREIELKTDFNGDVYFYYGLENYFQNHRRYMKSRSDRQLLGNLEDLKDCEPFSKDNNSQTYAPCGAIANSKFNDTFELTKNTFELTKNSTGSKVEWTYKDLVWPIDKTTKFRNPPITSGNLCDAFKGTVSPPNWGVKTCELDTNDASNNGFENADFIIWMRTAALPDFRKPYRKLVRKNEFADGLPAGNYTLIINNTYPVAAFSGRKSFIISTTSWAGGKNSFLGITYILVGIVCIVLGLVFLVVHMKYGHFLSEMSNIIDFRH